jgi:transcriptional regulator GlxA family with amidase domain
MAVEAWRALRSRFGPVIELPRASAAGLNVVRLSRMVEGRRLADRFEASEEAFGLTMSCWRQLSQRAESGAGAVEAAAQYCREHYRDAISVKELADQSGLTREHFTRLFREKIGMPPGNYLRERRLEAAEDLLGRHAVPLKEVAMRCGFYSTRQFVNAYRKAKGRAPRSGG